MGNPGGDCRVVFLRSRQEILFHIFSLMLWCLNVHRKQNFVIHPFFGGGGGGGRGVGQWRGRVYEKRVRLHASQSSILPFNFNCLWR